MPLLEAPNGPNVDQAIKFVLQQKDATLIGRVLRPHVEAVAAKLRN